MQAEKEGAKNSKSHNSKAISDKEHNVGQSASEFSDQRSETVIQKKLQHMADTYSNNHSVAHFQLMANGKTLPFSSVKPSNTNGQPDAGDTIQQKEKKAINDDTGLEKEADEMGNKAMQLRSSELNTATPVTKNNGASNNVYQRMVAVAHDDANTVTEFILLSHINYAQAKAGGATGEVKNIDFSTIDENETLFIVNHGRPGFVGKMSGSEVLKHLIHPKTGLPKSYRGTIFLSSCFSAETEVPGKPGMTVPQSLQHEILSGLYGKGYKGIDIIAAKGSSITNLEVTPDERPVVDPENVIKTKGVGGETAMNVQDRLKAKKYKSGKTTQELLDEWLKLNPTANLAKKAAKAAEISKPFYTEFINNLDRDKMLLGPGKGYLEQFIPSQYQVNIESGSEGKLSEQYEFAVRFKSTKRVLYKSKIKPGGKVIGTGNSEIMINFYKEADQNSWMHFGKGKQSTTPEGPKVEIVEI